MLIFHIMTFATLETVVDQVIASTQIIEARKKVTT
jgi:hypothetical protein